MQASAQHRKTDRKGDLPTEDHRPDRDTRATADRAPMDIDGAVDWLDLPNDIWYVVLSLISTDAVSLARLGATCHAMRALIDGNLDHEGRQRLWMRAVQDRWALFRDRPWRGLTWKRTYVSLHLAEMRHARAMSDAADLEPAVREYLHHFWAVRRGITCTSPPLIGDWEARFAEMIQRRKSNLNGFLGIVSDTTYRQSNSLSAGELLYMHLFQFMLECAGPHDDHAALTRSLDESLAIPVGHPFRRSVMKRVLAETLRHDAVECMHLIQARAFSETGEFMASTHFTGSGWVVADALTIAVRYGAEKIVDALLSKYPRRKECAGRSLLLMLARNETLDDKAQRVAREIVSFAPEALRFRAPIGGGQGGCILDRRLQTRSLDNALTLSLRMGRSDVATFLWGLAKDLGHDETGLAELVRVDDADRLPTNGVAWLRSVADRGEPDPSIECDREFFRRAVSMDREALPNSALLELPRILQARSVTDSLAVHGLNDAIGGAVDRWLVANPTWTPECLRALRGALDSAFGAWSDSRGLCLGCGRVGSEHGHGSACRPSPSTRRELCTEHRVLRRVDAYDEHLWPSGERDPAWLSRFRAGLVKEYESVLRNHGMSTASEREMQQRPVWQRAPDV